MGTYSAKDVVLDVDLQNKIPKGEYIIIANLENEKVGHIGCTQVNLKVQ